MLSLYLDNSSLMLSLYLDNSSLMLSLYLNPKPWECTGEKKVNLPAILKLILWPRDDGDVRISDFGLLAFWTSLNLLICSLSNDGISHSECKQFFNSASGIEGTNADFVWTD
jgi:hypothetical protein